MDKYSIVGTEVRQVNPDYNIQNIFVLWEGASFPTDEIVEAVRKDVQNDYPQYIGWTAFNEQNQRVNITSEATMPGPLKIKKQIGRLPVRRTIARIALDEQ